GAHRYRALPVATQLPGQHGDERKQGQQDGGVRALAWSDHWRWVSSPRWARLSANVTSSDQRMTTHSRSCAGVAWSSVQKNASRRRWPSGAATSTSRLATGGNPGVYPRAGREKPQSFWRWPPDHVTSTVSQGVSLRSAQPCKLRGRWPLMGLGPRLPLGCGPGGGYSAASQRRRETMGT